MRADELLVERFLGIEKKLEFAKEEIEDLMYDNETAKAEILEYEALVRVLSKYLKVTKYGICFELKNYVEEEKSDINYLANYFEVEFEEQPQGEV